MPDEFDAAQIREQLERDAAIGRARRGALLLQGMGRPDCEDCGEDIPEERRAVVPGAIRCAGCQTLHDRQFAR